MTYRKPTDSEARLLEELARPLIAKGLPSSWVRDVMVESMDEGGMGSLQFLNARCVKAVAPSPISIGSELMLLEVDGIEVIATIYVDTQGVPIEVDLWKVDYSRVISVTNPLPPSVLPME